MILLFVLAIVFGWLILGALLNTGESYAETLGELLEAAIVCVVFAIAVGAAVGLMTFIFLQLMMELLK